MPKTRNPVARSLKSTHLAPRAIRPAKGKGAYRRRPKHAVREIAA